MEQEEEVKAPTIMSISLKYGLLSAGVGILLFVVRAVLTENPFDNRSWSWTLLQIAVSIAVIVLAHREFKNNGDGFMSYGQGFKIGFLMSLIGIIITGVFTMFYINVIDTNAMQAMLDAQREQMETQGQPDAAIDMAQEWTKKLFWPIFFFAGTFFSTFIVLIVTIFTQRKNPDPAI